MYRYKNIQGNNTTVEIIIKYAVVKYNVKYIYIHISALCRYIHICI